MSSDIQKRHCQKEKRITQSKDKHENREQPFTREKNRGTKRCRRKKQNGTKQTTEILRSEGLKKHPTKEKSIPTETEKTKEIPDKATRQNRRYSRQFL